jgi:hypothetical protein
MGSPVGSRPNGKSEESVQISHDEWKSAGSPLAYDEGAVPNGWSFMKRQPDS